MTATPNPITWLTHNYVHEDWDHLLNNLSGYFSACTVLVVLYGTLFVLGYDFRRLIKMSAVVHAFAFVVAPLFSAFAWLALAGFVPQAASSKVLGFSTSVSAYVGADIALWAIAAAEAFNVNSLFYSPSSSSSFCSYQLSSIYHDQPSGWQQHLPYLVFGL